MKPEPIATPRLALIPVAAETAVEIGYGLAKPYRGRGYNTPRTCPAVRRAKPG
jgi:RimJ/RimL family protein N-acetyltransferase